MVQTARSVLDTQGVLAIIRDTYPSDKWNRNVEVRLAHLGVHNDYYRIDAEGGSYLFRILGSKYSKSRDWNLEFDFAGYVGGRGVSVAEAVAGPGHTLAGYVAFPEGSRQCSLFRIKAGSTYCSSIARTGKELARFHLASQAYMAQSSRQWEGPGTLKFSLCRLERFVNDPNVYNRVRQVVGEYNDRLGCMGLNDDLRGIIHGNLKPGKILWEGQQVTFLNFKDLSKGLFVYDLASIISLFRGSRLFRLKRYWLLHAYASVRKMQRSEYKALPVLENLHLLNNLLYHLEYGQGGRGFDEYIRMMIDEFLRRKV